MIGGIRVKVCGLTSVGDAEAAAGIGADFLGFILYPKSPRHISLARFVELCPSLPPALPKVAVMVTPTPEEARSALGAGFDFLQVHFPPVSASDLLPVAALAGAARLWLAPKLPVEAEIEAALLPLAGKWLLDTYRADSFGGTGHTGDWGKFRRYRETFPGTTWILAGGLSPENVAAAVAVSGAEVIDVNSGVESRPGCKDLRKLAALRAAILGRSTP